MSVLNKQKRLLLNFAVLLVLATGMGWLVVKKSGEERKPLPPVKMAFLDGSKPTLANYRGKVVLGVFWSVSCETCVEEIPHLNALYEKHKQNNFVVIGFDMPYDRPDWTVKFVKERPIKYPVSLDMEGDIARAFGGVQATPTTVLIDKHGRVVWKRLGRTDFSKLETEIQSLAKES
ncbi:MAG: TlpA family protein disulfide reductase [Acidiferrobacterales bacterium]